jgi:hypothetical protein
LTSCACGKDALEIAPSKGRLGSDEFANTAAFTLQGHLAQEGKNEFAQVNMK